MSFVKSLLKPIARKVCARQARVKISRLAEIDDPAAQKIATAIRETLDQVLESEEKGWVDKIEEKRRELNSSSKPVSKTDFGAGTPDLERTKDQMYDGIVATSTVGEICQSASKPYFWSLLLFKLVRQFEPKIGIELGTCLGISASYQASAQKLNRVGKFITLEGSNPLAALAQSNFQALGLDNVQVVSGRFQDNLDQVLAENKPIDYAFIDGHHDGKATLEYFKKFAPYLSSNAILIFDDISWSDGMRDAWDTIDKNDTVKISMNLRTIGICVLDQKMEGKYSFNMPLY